jgi:hypothetical protein
MKSEHPLSECYKIIENWETLCSQWEEEYKSKYYPPEDEEEILLFLNPLEGITLDHFLAANFKEMVLTAYRKVKLKYKIIVSKLDQLDFLSGIFDAVDSLFEQIDDNNVEKKIKSIILEEFNNLRNKLYETYNNKLIELSLHLGKPSERARIRFNLSRAEIIYLFTALKEANIISMQVSDTVIDKLLSNYFAYLKSTEGEDDKYVPLKKGLKKAMGNMRSDAQFSEETARRVKDILSKIRVKF